MTFKNTYMDYTVTISIIISELYQVKRISVTIPVLHIGAVGVNEGS